MLDRMNEEDKKKTDGTERKKRFERFKGEKIEKHRKKCIEMCVLGYLEC